VAVGSTVKTRDLLRLINNSIPTAATNFSCLGLSKLARPDQF
jgi:hypothetical protein